MTVAVPRGWEAELSLLEEAATIDTAVRYAARPPVVLHVANFALPVERGDYGSGAVEMMDSGSIFMSLLEFDRASASTALFSASGLPTELDPEAFSPQQLQRPQRNQSGLQRFLHVRDRAFCLYVVLGSHTARRILSAEAMRLVSGITID